MHLIVERKDGVQYLSNLPSIEYLFCFISLSSASLFLAIRTTVFLLVYFHSSSSLIFYYDCLLLLLLAILHVTRPIFLLICSICLYSVYWPIRSLFDNHKHTHFYRNLNACVVLLVAWHDSSLIFCCSLRRTPKAVLLVTTSTTTISSLDSNERQDSRLCCFAKEINEKYVDHTRTSSLEHVVVVVVSVLLPTKRWATFASSPSLRKHWWSRTSIG